MTRGLNEIFYLKHQRTKFFSNFPNFSTGNSETKKARNLIGSLFLKNISILVPERTFYDFSSLD